MRIAILLCTLLCIEWGHGLQCYQHDYCIGKCPPSASTIQQCRPGQTNCWKFTSFVGTMRGCGERHCQVQIDTGAFGTANVCCSTDLCNSAVSMKSITGFFLFNALFAIMYAWTLL